MCSCCEDYDWRIVVVCFKSGGRKIVIGSAHDAPLPTMRVLHILIVAQDHLCAYGGDCD